MYVLEVPNYIFSRFLKSVLFMNDNFKNIIFCAIYDYIASLAQMGKPEITMKMKVKKYILCSLKSLWMFIFGWRKKYSFSIKACYSKTVPASVIKLLFRKPIFIALALLFSAILYYVYLCILPLFQTLWYVI